jgi:hypothetical protein
MSLRSKVRARRLTPGQLSFVAVLAALIALSLPAAASADAPRPHTPIIVPPLGKLYDNLSVLWWQYTLGQPAATNPLLDETGAGCATGQSGPVFFLVGTGGTGELTRDQCSVRAGKLLFFPLVNGFDVHTPGDGLDDADLVYHDFSVTLAFRVDSLYASVDGVPVSHLDPATSPLRACAAPVAGCTRPFSLTLPDANLFGIPAGTYAPAVADGFYLLLAPLKPGVHTISFGGTGNFGSENPSPFSQDITYRLRVRR